MQIINLDIIKHPLNWVIILLMLVILGIAGHVLLSKVGIEPAS